MVVHLLVASFAALNAQQVDAAVSPAAKVSTITSGKTSITITCKSLKPHAEIWVTIFDKSGCKGRIVKGTRSQIVKTIGGTATFSFSGLKKNTNYWVCVGSGTKKVKAGSKTVKYVQGVYNQKMIYQKYFRTKK